jgi:DNA replication protein DnaC
MRIVKTQPLGHCETCGEPATWVNAQGETVPEPMEFRFGIRRVGHEACAEKERAAREERQREEIEVERRRIETEAKARRRSRLADEILFPESRLGELDLAKIPSPTLRSWTPGKPGVLLYGTTGVGKTFALRAFALHVFERFDIWPTWVNVNRFFDHLKSDFDKAEAATVAVEKAQLLILDDLGAEKLTEWAETKMERILSVRFDYERPVFVSTNLTPSGFKDRFGPRTLSRLSGLCQFVPFHGADRRGQALAERQKGPST